MARFLGWAAGCRPWKKEHGRAVGLWCRVMPSLESCCVWDASHRSIGSCQFCEWNIWLLSLNLASCGGSWVTQFSQSISSMQAPHWSCLLPVQGSPSQGKMSPCCFVRKVVYITKVVTLLLPNFICKNCGMDFRLLWQSRVSHALVLLILVPLPKVFHLCDSFQPSLPPISYVSTPVSPLFGIFLSHSPTAELRNQDQTIIGKAHLKADKTWVCGCYSFIASEL